MRYERGEEWQDHGGIEGKELGLGLEIRQETNVGIQEELPGRQRVQS